MVARFHWDPTPGSTCFLIQYREPDSDAWLLSIVASASRLDVIAPSIPLRTGRWCFRATAGSNAGLSAPSDEACIEIPAVPAPVPATIAVSWPATLRIEARATIWFQGPTIPPPGAPSKLEVVNQSDHAATVSYDGSTLTIAPDDDFVPVIVHAPDEAMCMEVHQSGDVLSCTVGGVGQTAQVVFTLLAASTGCE